MNDTLRSELLGTAGLLVAATAALYLTVSRGPANRSHTDLPRATRIFALLLLFQAVHAAEEYATRFYEAYPEVLGLGAPWPAGFFLAFNVFWFAVWTAAGLALHRGYTVAFFPVWFLAIASMGNGIVHPLLAIVTGGYFPGLLTSPLVGIGGILLWRNLMNITIVEA